MNWTQELIFNAISEAPDFAQGEFCLVLFDETHKTGIGYGHKGQRVLILPGQPSVEDITGVHLNFQSWFSAQLDDGTMLKDISITQCNFGEFATEDLEAISFIYHALIQQCTQSADVSAAGKTIHSLRSLFENKLKHEVSREVEIGLIGEFLVIDSSEDVDFLIDVWHDDSANAFDFSLNSERIEVKTTTSKKRLHEFSSNQLPVENQINLHVASVQLYEVSKGESLASIFNRLHERLTNKSLDEKLLRISIQTLGTHPTLVCSVQFDYAASTSSIRLFQPIDIPTPTKSIGVEYMKWTAILSEDKAVEGNSELTSKILVIGS
jgi:hypothetical protein